MAKILLADHEDTWDFYPTYVIEFDDELTDEEQAEVQLALKGKCPVNFGAAETALGKLAGAINDRITAERLMKSLHRHQVERWNWYRSALNTI